jgi:hypothetical protein
MLTRAQRHIHECGELQGLGWTPKVQRGTGGTGNRLRAELFQDEEIASGTSA